MSNNDKNNNQEIVWDVAEIAKQGLGKSDGPKAEGNLTKLLPHQTYVSLVLNPDGNTPGCQYWRSYSSVAFGLFIEWMSARGAVKLHAAGDRRPMRFLMQFMIGLDAFGDRVLLNQDLGGSYKEDVEFIYEMSKQMISQKLDIFDRDRCGYCPDCRGERMDTKGVFPTDASGYKDTFSGISDDMEIAPKDDEDDNDEEVNIADEF